VRGVLRTLPRPDPRVASTGATGVASRVTVAGEATTAAAGTPLCGPAHRQPISGVPDQRAQETSSDDGWRAASSFSRRTGARCKSLAARTSYLGRPVTGGLSPCPPAHGSAPVWRTVRRVGAHALTRHELMRVTAHQRRMSGCRRRILRARRLPDAHPAVFRATKSTPWGTAEQSGRRSPSVTPSPELTAVTPRRPKGWTPRADDPGGGTDG
jgi:hypothetical protein